MCSICNAALSCFCQTCQEGNLYIRSIAFVYFSYPIPKELLARIKNDTSVLPRIGALREMNLEYFPIDTQVIIDSSAYVTDQEMALEELFGDNAETSNKFEACLNLMATRVATIFASLKEFPFVRYRAAKSVDSSAEKTSRDLVPTKLAAAVWNRIASYKSTIPNFPQTETCELLILDRSVDQIAPVIHEWTYDAMCHDLLDMDGNKYMHEVHLPDCRIFLWRNSYEKIVVEANTCLILADASERLHERMTNFKSKNKAAQLQQRDSSELSTRDLQKMVQALPQYNEQMEKLSLHVEVSFIFTYRVELRNGLQVNWWSGFAIRLIIYLFLVQIAGKINKIIRDTGLRDLGQLEQDIVFGDKGTKDIITHLRANQAGIISDEGSENKLRLLMIYGSVYPEKFEGEKASKLMQLAKLSPEDMKAVKNMRVLEGSDGRKTATGGFSLKFDGHKRKHAARKDKTGEEETWMLSRFYPVIEELIEQLSKGELPKEEYQCMNEPAQTARPGSTRTLNASAKTGQSTAPVPAPHSMRSRRTPTWAKRGHSDDGYSSDSVVGNVSTDFKKMGQRIFVFIIGGATRSELRVCHKLTTKLRREVVLGSSSIDDPPQYLTDSRIFNILLSFFWSKYLMAVDLDDHVKFP
ncbi:unnamed protein product [Thlaspi arvense]|uniref:SNARE-interacting protein KEULE n=1 Tax=Thlaspi arvense TaxID=13288 RepID=A0AAU9S6W3_THLAR|nr:unnamed protein product [Thlaspi arvense]